MIDDITRLPTPEWLMALNAYKLTTQDIPLRNILHGSLYYPAAGFDGDPVKYLAGNIHSFVYVDYSKSKAAFMEEINSDYRSFKGYEIVGKREVRMEELIPKGWTIQVKPESHENFSEYKNWTEKPYCVWTVFQRNSEYDSRHGPERFSLLYLCADGAAAYQALYNSNNYRPKDFGNHSAGIRLWWQLYGFQAPRWNFGKISQGQRCRNSRLSHQWGQRWSWVL